MHRPATDRAALATALALTLTLPLLAEEEPPPIEGFEQILPRGKIPALVDPEFVAADEAEVPDEAWMLGFTRDGEAYAYDLNLLNRHEVVNHTIGDTPVAAVW